MNRETRPLDANPVRILNLMWANLFGSLLLIIGGLMFAVSRGAIPHTPLGISDWLPPIFAALTAGVLPVAWTVRRHYFSQAARLPVEPSQRRLHVQTRMFVLAGILDGPPIIACGLYAVEQQEWLAMFVVVYALLVGYLYKPDFRGLLQT